MTLRSSIRKAGSLVILLSTGAVLMTACTGTVAPGMLPIAQVGRVPRVQPPGPGIAHHVPNDARFIDSMIPHHQSAIDIGLEVLTMGEHPEVRALARSIVTRQQAEIAQMSAWRDAWYPSLPNSADRSLPTAMPIEMPMDALFEMAMYMPAEQGLPTMQTVTAHAPWPFDERFVDAMIPRHQGAVAMATRAMAEAEHPELKALAAGIVSSQRAEIETLKAWRVEWQGPEPTALAR